MNLFKKNIAMAMVLVLGMLACGVASATVIVMQFDQLNPNGEYVGSYYDGGCGTSYSSGSITCSGPNDGIVWNSALAGAASPTGAWNTTGNEPSPNNVMGFLNTDNATMILAGGFTGGFSFWYSSPFFSNAVVSMYDASNTLVASFTLPATGTSCANFIPGVFASCWVPVGVGFTATVTKVVFSGTANQFLLDNVTLGQATPFGAPEPAALGMFGLGLLLIGGFVTLRRRQVQKV